MCGIAGFVGKGDQKTLDEMTSVLSRRGPDDRGTYLEDGVGFAHTRLAVVDLSPLGHQPMTSTTGKTVIIFNGEIYNFKELRTDIEQKGTYTFRSQSDTEVILALFEEYGEKAFEKINGMFAIALYDIPKKKLYLVRDRLGKKPLYYGVVNGTLLFGSELKALMCHESWQGTIDKKALALYLTYEYVPTPYSIFENIHKLEPGTFITYADGKIIDKKTFWKPEIREFNGTLSEGIGQLDARLEQAVKERLVADVPVGIFLSGGIDSSTVAYYAKKVSDATIKTFSISFGEASFDESKEANLVANHLGTDHHTEHFSIEKCIDLIPEVYSYLDEPMADASILPTYLLSLSTKKHVTVALGGDGADELFGGYRTFQAERMLYWYRMIPKIIREKLISPFILSLPTSHSYMSSDFLLKKFLDGSEKNDRERHQYWLGAFADQSVLRDSWQSKEFDVFSIVDSYFTELGNTSLFTKIRWIYLRTYLMDQVMVKVDRASMEASLEVRSPFLDFHVVNFALSLPQRFSLRRLSGKYILKKMMEGKLPKEIIHRKKKGFAIPIGTWLQHELEPVMNKLLSKENLERSGIFEYEEVQKLRTEHTHGLKDNRKKLWTVLVFLMWYDAFALKK